MKTILAAAILIGLQWSPVDDAEYTRRLESALLYELKPLAVAFVEAERRYDVSAVMLAAIAALESGWGRDCFTENNLFGFGDKEFVSREACVNYVASYMRLHYLTPCGRCFNGYELEDINICWNPVNPGWAASVRNIMHRIEDGMARDAASEMLSEREASERRMAVS